MLVRLAALLSVALLLPAAAAQEKPESEQPAPLWWMFFLAGENKTPLEREEAQRMQKAHIENLSRLGREGKSLTAGPFGDRGPLRGIVVLTLKTREEVEAEFRDDPFVKAGYMKLQPLRLRAGKEGFGKAVEPFELEEFRLLLYRKGPKWTPEETEQTRRDQDGHLSLIRAGIASGAVALAGPFLDGGDMRGLLLFRAKDPAGAEKLLAEDPHVRSGRLVGEVRPLYLPKGSVKPAAPLK